MTINICPPPMSKSCQYCYTNSKFFFILRISSKITKLEDGTGKRVSFESFPRSVQQLTLNSINSTEAADVLLDDTSANVSIFYSKLLHWEELNLSQGFTELNRRVRKFSNLPLVIFNHNEVRRFIKSKWLGVCLYMCWPPPRINIRTNTMPLFPN